MAAEIACGLRNRTKAMYDDLKNSYFFALFFFSKSLVHIRLLIYSKVVNMLKQLTVRFIW